MFLSMPHGAADLRDPGLGLRGTTAWSFICHVPGWLGRGGQVVEVVTRCTEGQDTVQLWRHRDVHGETEPGADLPENHGGPPGGSVRVHRKGRQRGPQLPEAFSDVSYPLSSVPLLDHTLSEEAAFLPAGSKEHQEQRWQVSRELGGSPKQACRQSLPSSRAFARPGNAAHPGKAFLTRHVTCSTCILPLGPAHLRGRGWDDLHGSK